MCENGRISPQPIAWASRESAAVEHGEARERQPFRTVDGEAALAIAKMPGGTGPRIKKDADDGEIEFSAPAGRGIGPSGAAGDIAPSVNAFQNKMPPARVKRHVQGGVGLARCLQ